MRTQVEKAETFRALHHRNHAFIIPNPWDVGTARLLETLGFEALATTKRGICLFNRKTGWRSRARTDACACGRDCRCDGLAC
jgi:hypothetical protein